jgi:hypothetical protein
MNDEQRAAAILREVSRRAEWEVGRQPTYRASFELFCCIRVAAEDAAEVVRLLEIYRRASGLTPESLAALKRYRRIYEVAQLVLMEYYSHPEGLTPTVLENFFKVTEGDVTIPRIK